MNDSYMHIYIQGPKEYHDIVIYIAWLFYLN